MYYIILQYLKLDAQIMILVNNILKLKKKFARYF